MPFDNIVLGNSPEPQRRKDPKSLYQSPSGASGPVFAQSCKRTRSRSVICRSATRVRRCSQTGPGRLVNRIFGNGFCAENRADQISAGFIFTHRIGFRHKPAIGCAEILLGLCLGLNTALRELYERTARSKTPLLCDAPDFGCQGGRERHALTHGRGFRGTGLGFDAHLYIL